MTAQPPPLNPTEPQALDTRATDRSTSEIDQVVHDYGDLLFDLCESVLWSPANAQVAFRGIIKRVKSATSRSRGLFRSEENVRGWVLGLACEFLIPFAKQNARKVTPSEQIQVDASQNVSTRLRQINFYFHRLIIDDQLLLLLRDKYGLPYSEIETALGVPEGSLKVRRQQALRTLEEWLWESE